MNPATTASSVLDKKTFISQGQEEVPSKKKKNIAKLEAIAIESQDVDPVEPKLKFETSIFEGKHLAKRNIKDWVQYGNPEIFNEMFEEGVLKAVSGITKGKWNPTELVSFRCLST